MESQNKLFEAFREAAAADEQTTFLAQDKLWDRIEQQLDKKETRKIQFFSFSAIKYVAAALVVITGIALGWNYSSTDQHINNNVAVTNTVQSPVSAGAAPSVMRNEQFDAGGSEVRNIRVAKPALVVANKANGKVLTGTANDDVSDVAAKKSAPVLFQDPALNPGASNQHLLVNEETLQHADPTAVVQDLSPRAIEPATDIPAVRLLKLQGIIVDKAGVALENARVSVPGTGRTVTSDAMGNFVLEVPDTAQLIMVQSYGNETKYVKVAERHNYKIEISPDQSNVALLNDITRYNRKGMQNLSSGPVNVTNMRQELASKQKQQTVLRQAPSNDPLIIINGAPYNGKFSDINSKHIKEVKILSEANARVLYGDRARNGVIVITLKKGKTVPGQ